MQNPWPRLEYNEWIHTYETLHRWTQIVGKVRLRKTDWVNHSWHSTLYVTSSGLSTSPIYDGERSFTIDFDFCTHQLVVTTNEGVKVAWPLQSESVADFYHRLMQTIDSLHFRVHIDPRPNEVDDSTPFYNDMFHATYVPARAQSFWQVLVQVDRVLKKFRSEFLGKCSPVHFFWGSFDMAVTRFSGRAAPAHPGGVPHLPDRVAREAYSHEVSSCGFWPGNEIYPHAAFYSYAYPEPEGLSQAKIEPASAFYHSGLHEFILPYEAVRTAASPEQEILKFCKSTYEAAADLGHWDRESLEFSRYLLECRRAPQIRPRDIHSSWPTISH